MPISVRTPIVAAAIYAVLVTLAILVGLGGACCGEQAVWASVLTLPWSVVGVVALDAIDPNLTDRFGPLALIPGALANATIIYLFARARTRRAESRSSRSGKDPAA
jgi:hypothetical protein